MSPRDILRRLGEQIREEMAQITISVIGMDENDLRMETDPGTRWSTGTVTPGTMPPGRGARRKGELGEAETDAKTNTRGRSISPYSPSGA
jgi:hypothetical protein